jgi:hypothetical protein
MAEASPRGRPAAVEPAEAPSRVDALTALARSFGNRYRTSILNRCRTGPATNSKLDLDCVLGTLMQRRDLRQQQRERLQQQLLAD